MQRTPVSLLDRVRQPGADEAWSQFVELYTPVFYAWTRRLGLSAADAADLVQDVFTLLVEKLPEFVYDRHKSFRGWLKTLLLNKWRDHRRRLAAGPRAVGADHMDGLPDESIAGFPSRVVTSNSTPASSIWMGGSGAAHHRQRLAIAP